MLNAELRKTKPVWSERADNGGMFSSVLAVYHDPDGAPGLRYLAVLTDGWGGGCQARRPSLEAAVAYAWEMHERTFG